jgi:5-methylthioribose kinase
VWNEKHEQKLKINLINQVQTLVIHNILGDALGYAAQNYLAWTKRLYARLPSK